MFVQFCRDSLQPGSGALKPAARASGTQPSYTWPALYASPESAVSNEIPSDKKESKDNKEDDVIQPPTPKAEKPTFPHPISEEYISETPDAIRQLQKARMGMGKEQKEEERKTSEKKDWIYNSLSY